MQELLNLLDQQKYEEALKGFERIYESSQNPIALYYITFIKFYYLRNYDLDELYNNFKTLYNYNKFIRLRIYDLYLSFLIDNEDYELALKISKQSLKETKESFVNYYSYSKSLFKLNKDLDKAIEYAKKCCEIEYLSETQKLVSYGNLVEIYCFKKEFDLAKETVKKMYLFSSNICLATLSELKIAIAEQNDDYINKSVKECLKFKEIEADTYSLLYDYYYETNQFELAIEYLNKIKPLLSSPTIANEKIVNCYLHLSKFDEGIKFLKENPCKEDEYTNYLLGELYCYKGGIQNLNEALKYCKMALETAKDKEMILKMLGDIYFELVDTDNLLKISNELRSMSKNGYADYLLARYYRLTKDFDKAEKLIKTMKKNNVPHYRINTIINYCSTKPEILNSHHLEVFNKNDNKSIRNKIKILMFGQYGLNISMEEAKKHIEELEKKENLFSHEYETISTFYLFNNEEEIAYKYANKGYEMHLKGEEYDHCCAALIAYFKLKGIGTKKNVEEAYKICKTIEEGGLGEINENAGHVYAECAILLNKDLNHAYEILEKTLFRRYSPSRYFMLVKIGKILNKDTSKYSKLFKESLKHCSIREKEYYSVEQKDFLINIK